MKNKNNEQELPLGLYWKGKRTTVDRIVLPFQSLEVVETINESRATREKEKGKVDMFKESSEQYHEGNDNWRNKLIWGDNKYVMSALLEKYSGKIDLIYIDPPFATGADFSTKVKIGENKKKLIEHIKEANVIEEVAYRDTWGKGLDSFLQMMYDRIVLIRQLLSEKGLFYLHIDWHTSHYIKIICDEIFGTDNLLNEIIWNYETYSGNVKRYFPRKHDVILFYCKSDKYNFELPYLDDFEDSINYERWKQYIVDGNKILGANYPKTDSRFTVRLNKWIRVNGRQPKADDVIFEINSFAVSSTWKDINAVDPKDIVEKLEYPTQKPEALLSRIIKSSTKVGDLVADFFCGSGTTAAVAEKLGRRWIAGDLGRFAIHTTRKRMLEIENCKPFEILNIGKYERQYWQTINFGKKRPEQTIAEYIAFVLKLYKAEVLPGSSYIYGKKGNKLIHIGNVDAPVTFRDIQLALNETKRMNQKELVVLGWDWEMGLHDVVEQEAKKAGIKLHLLNIPREAMDRQAIDTGDIQFFELAYLETEVKKSAQCYQIKLTDFIIPNLDLIPAEVKKLIKKWSDYIDYWSVDWDYKDDTFHNQWQSYRTKKDRNLDLKTDYYEYSKKGDYKVMVKVIDIFGNDTTHIIELKHR